MAFAGSGNDSSAAGNFTKWLNDKLRQLNTDESVFGSYITGILEDDETIEEKKDALEGILGEIIDNNIEEVIEEILNKWNECHPKEKDDSKPKLKVDVDVQLAKMLESQKLQTTVQRQYTADELRIREQILAQYSQTEISEEEDADEPDEKASTAGLQKNTNVHDVIQLQKERREQARLDSQKKKEKDKEDREKQKQLREEKKEKRKTVKGERRR
ncbi:coiled-coil domain-containing protein 43 [Episyrphus balteatus]|uniref:coiled-coil domain-containing protein 43 n=1 Tax=Episyrphus balteatus TaxID=286459 RepID=UPI0024861F68|nr:coiled-coil domain-containing protein 43 [Episyrphus balteatus]